MNSSSAVQLDLIRNAARLSIRPQLLTTFHLFGDLPAELRIKIWKAALTPRVVTILTQTTNVNTTNNIAFYTTSPPPTLLSVSHESRSEALSSYRLSFSTSQNLPTTYFNPHLDTLYFPRHREMGYDEVLRDFRDLVKDDKDWLNQTTKVAVDVVDMDIKRPWESYNKTHFLRGFRMLEEVVIVLNNKSALPVEGGGEKRIWDTQLVEPVQNPENMLWAWAMFRHSFMAEERYIAEACQDSELEYHPFRLPTVKVKERQFIKMWRS
jgi:hypothetical protein